MPFVSRFVLSIAVLAVSTQAHDVIKGKYKSYYLSQITVPAKIKAI